MIKGYFYIICLIYFYLVSCSEVNTKRNKVDTISTVSSVLVKKNTVNLNNTENLDTSSDSELIDILNQYKAEYNRNYNVDTSFKVGSDLFHVIFKYKCTFDSGLNIPQKVISIYGLKKFITHNFISSVLVFKNEEPFIKQEINKNTFSELCDSSLKTYGSLLYPYIVINNLPNILEIHFSISIPLTDVGKAVIITFDNKGKVGIK